MLVYADTNIYCRPLDDRIQPRIAVEAEACLNILEAIENKQIKCLSSDILKIEIYQADPLKKIYIAPYLAFANKHIRESEKIKKLAIKLQQKYRLKSRDALHLASALEGKAKYFLTCDDEVLRKAKNIKEIKIINPLEFIKEL